MSAEIGEADCSRQWVQASVTRRRLCTSGRLAPSALGNSTLRGAGRARRRSRFEPAPKGFGGDSRSQRRVHLTVPGVRFVVVGNVIAEHVRAVGIGAVQHDGIGVGACDGRESNRRHRLRLRPTTVPRTSLLPSWCFRLLAGSSCWTRFDPGVPGRRCRHC